jgi:hypothetical protein
LPPARLTALTRGLEALVDAMGGVPGEAPMFFEDEK